MYIGTHPSGTGRVPYVRPSPGARRNGSGGMCVCVCVVVCVGAELLVALAGRKRGRAPGKGRRLGQGCLAVASRCTAREPLWVTGGRRRESLHTLMRRVRQLWHLVRRTAGQGHVWKGGGWRTHPWEALPQ